MSLPPTAPRGHLSAGFESDCIFQTTKHKLYVRFKEPKLFRYARDGRWDRIESRCSTHPKEARFVHAYPPCDTALHRILRARLVPSSFCGSDSIGEDLMKTKGRAVAALIRASPKIVHKEDSFGRTPLHLACMDPFIREKDVEVLAGIAPDICVSKDKDGRTPLHLACMAMAEAQCCAVKSLSRPVGEELPLQRNEKKGMALESSGQDKQGNIVFASEPTSTNDGGIVKLLLDMSPNAVSIPDDQGNTPLQYMFQHISNLIHDRISVDEGTVSITKALLFANPSAIAHPDVQNQAPLTTLLELYPAMKSEVESSDGIGLCVGDHSGLLEGKEMGN